MSRGRRGFTLIELLVVIAIIGILAAMLFPVFARARESARKTQCLANVKNIATAINMYAADYDKMFPSETRREVIDYFSGMEGKGAVRATWPEICNHASHANPYLRQAVILEDYVKSKDVWKCPSAKMMNGAGFIVPMGPNGDWVQSYRDNDKWGRISGGGTGDYGPCNAAWPTGWGGDVTDSFKQDRMASTSFGANTAGAGNSVFVQGVGLNTGWWDMGGLTNLNLSTVGDASRYVACGDAGKQVTLQFADWLAYPDGPCGLNYSCGGSSCPNACNWADWANCSWSQTCGLPNSLANKFYGDPTFRKPFTRHMGGSNVGFLDGHAKWFLADAIIKQSEPYKDPYFEGGLCACWPDNGAVPIGVP